MMSKLLVILILIGFFKHVLVAPTIDHNIVAQLRENQIINVLVSMKESTQSVLSSLRLQTFTTREDRLNGVANALKVFATNSQKNVHALLIRKEQEGKSFSWKVLWVTNQIVIRNVNLDLLEKLVTIDEVATIEPERFIQLDEPIDLNIVDDHDLQPADEDEVQWGVQQIEAPAVWKQGNTGQNIIIATIDTGARGSHETLRNNFAGEYGWFDPGRNTSEPNDQNGHGTHTTANIAGTVRNVGVAPGSKWAACKGCASSSCSEVDLLECGQWMICPTKWDGSESNCPMAPHIVSNSWGGLRGNQWYYTVIYTFHVAGIIPLFSIGNSGPSCGTANSPGDYDNVIGVGSTAVDDQLSHFSSTGPTIIGGRIKPEISAPGSNVFSAYYTSDTAYATMSGTSMACPHAAGVVALLLQANPRLTYDQVKKSLNGGGVPTTPTNRNCGEISEDEYPNHHVGYGRISAVKTIATMIKLYGE